MKLFGFPFWIFIFSTQAALADGQGGQRPVAYLELGVGGAQNAMAGAAVAGRDDPACGFWNPAGLSGLRGFQTEAQYTLLAQGQVLDYLTLANRIDDGIFFGFSFFYYSAGGDIEARIGPSLVPDSLFGDTEKTFLGSLAFHLDPRWSIGLNIKVMTQDFNHYSGIGFGEDLGLQYRVTQFTTLGLMIQNPYTFFDYDNTTNTIVPFTLKAGVSHRVEALESKGNFDLEWSPDLGLRPHLGLEWRPEEDVLAIRAGCWVGNLTAGVSDGLSFNPTAGFGLLLPMGGDSSVEFNYTLLTDRTSPGTFFHQVALTGKFL